MKKLKLDKGSGFVLLLFALVFVGMGTAGLADMVAIGVPYDANSWGQTFNESGVGNFDFIAIEIYSGGPFEAPGGMHSFTAAGWAVTFNSPGLVIAKGSALANMNFDIKFEGEKGTPLIFFFYAYLGTDLKEAARAVWNGNDWSFAVITSTVLASKYNDILASTAVPEPGILLLLAMGTTATLLRRQKQ